MAVKAETPLPTLTARRPSRRGPRRLPYGMLAPTALVLLVVLGYPLYRLVDISLRHFGFAQAINPNAPAPFVGLQNYRQLFASDQFYTVILRTTVFTAVLVISTIVLGLLMALLMQRCSNWMRILLSIILISIWAMPRVVQTEIWKWLTDYEFGVFNYILAHLGLHQFSHYNWFVASRPVPGFVVIGLLVVWGALPFVVLTLYAALTQVPVELIEAARVDGAGPWSVFRNVTLPFIKPMLVIITTLSVIWDFGVFDQIYVMLDNVPDKRFWTMGIYLYEEAFGQGNFGLGAAISIVLVLAMFLVGALYLRQMVRLGETQ